MAYDQESEQQVQAGRGVGPVACTLTTKQAANQVLEWEELQDHVYERHAIDGGARMTFSATLAPQINDLVKREGECCSFLSITTSVQQQTLTMEVTSANPDAGPVIAKLAGLPSPEV